MAKASMTWNIHLCFTSLRFEYKDPLSAHSSYNSIISKWITGQSVTDELLQSSECVRAWHLQSHWCLQVWFK